MGSHIQGSPVRATRVFRAFSTRFVGAWYNGGLHPRLWSDQPFRLKVSAIEARDEAIFTRIKDQSLHTFMKSTTIMGCGGLVFEQNGAIFDTILGLFFALEVIFLLFIYFG